MILQFFLQGKSLELIRMFKKAPQQERSDASAILSQLDITNASKYKDELK
jgi:hypothetical protein